MIAWRAGSTRRCRPVGQSKLMNTKGTNCLNSVVVAAITAPFLLNCGSCAATERAYN